MQGVFTAMLKNLFTSKRWFGVLLSLTVVLELLILHP